MEELKQHINLSYEDLEKVLSTVVSSNPKKEDLQQAQQILRDFSKNPLSVELFLLQMKQNQNFKVRQLAAILLNRKFEKFWNDFTSEQKNQIKGLLLELYQNEKVFLVAKALSQLIFRISKLTLIAENWGDVLDYVFRDPSTYSQEQANIFELNLYIISELIDTCSFYLKAKLDMIKDILVLSMTHGSNRVNIF